MQSQTCIFQPRTCAHALCMWIPDDVRTAGTPLARRWRGRAMAPASSRRAAKARRPMQHHSSQWHHHSLHHPVGTPMSLLHRGPRVTQHGIPPQVTPTHMIGWITAAQKRRRRRRREKVPPIRSPVGHPVCFAQVCCVQLPPTPPNGHR